MKTRTPFWAAAAFTVLAACSQDDASQESVATDAPVATHAFVDVNVLPMDRERVLAGQTVLVADGRITRMGAAAEVEVPEGATAIDGRGKYLMPGVAEMHGHFPDPDAREFTEAVLYLYVANGVTLVRGMQGNAGHLPLRDAIEARQVTGPRLLVSSPAMSGNNVERPDDARRLVRDAAAAGFDHIKVQEGLTPEVYSAIAETAKEVGLTFSGHVSNLVGLYASLEQGQSTVDHLDNYIEAMIDDPEIVAGMSLFDLPQMLHLVDEDRMGDVIAATLEAGAGVVPTQVLWETFLDGRSGAEILADSPETRYWVRESLPGVASGVNRWMQQKDELAAALSQPDAGRPVIELRRRLIKALHDAGVPVLFGTDSPQVFSVPGFSVHREMQVMVESGLTPFQVLYSGSVAIADFLGADDFGRVAEGQRADLVLLNANPLDDIGHFADSAGVMVNGQWIPREEIDAGLAEIEAMMAARDGWITLFDGTSLESWTGIGAAQWTVADGVVEGSGGSGHLLSNESYSDFVLTLEFWVDDPANSGVFIRCADPEAVTPDSCYEVNIYDQRPDPTYRTGSIVNFAAPAAQIDAGGQWNSYEIRAEGTRLHVTLNGTVTVDIEDDTFIEGPFTLQYGSGIVRFRNVRIRPL